MKDASFILGMETMVPQASIVDNVPYSSSIDVSAYVDIPDGRLLRIKAVNFRLTDENNLPLNPLVATQKATDSEMDVAYHLSTSEKAYRVSLADTNIIASGLDYFLATHAQDCWINIFSGGDSTPEDWEDGFLAATDTLWLTFQTENYDTAYSGLKVSCQLECEMVKATRADALSVAVAQATSSA